MKRALLILVCGMLCMLSGCKKDATSPSVTALCGTDDFLFPASATKFSVTLYSECASVAIGTEFLVKLVVYNVTDVFGTAAEFSLPSDKIDLISATSGSLFSPNTDIIALGGPVQGTSNYAYGVTFRAGTNRTMTGSGVLVKLRCKAKAAGVATFTINPAKLEIKKSDGTPITNFNSILVENTSITIQ